MWCDPVYKCNIFFGKRLVSFHHLFKYIVLTKIKPACGSTMCSSYQQKERKNKKGKTTKMSKQSQEEKKSSKSLDQCQMVSGIRVCPCPLPGRRSRSIVTGSTIWARARIISSLILRWLCLCLCLGLIIVRNRCPWAAPNMSAPCLGAGVYCGPSPCSSSSSGRCRWSCWSTPCS